MIRLFNIIHQNSIEPVTITSNDETYEITMTSNNSYFAIGNYKQIFGVDNLSPGDLLISDICKFKIISYS